MQGRVQMYSPSLGQGVLVDRKGRRVVFRLAEGSRIPFGGERIELLLNDDGSTRLRPLSPDPEDPRPLELPASPNHGTQLRKRSPGFGKCHA